MMSGTTNKAQALILITLLALMAGCGTDTPVLSDIDVGLFDAVKQAEPDRAESLVQAGAHIDSINNEGSTPLIEAVLLGHLEMVEKLLSLGADASLPDKNGNSALLHAVKTGHVDMVKALLLIVPQDANQVHEETDTSDADDEANLRKMVRDEVVRELENVIEARFDAVLNNYATIENARKISVAAAEEIVSGEVERAVAEFSSDTRAAMVEELRDEVRTNLVREFVPNSSLASPELSAAIVRVVSDLYASAKDALIDEMSDEVLAKLPQKSGNSSAPPGFADTVEAVVSELYSRERAKFVEEISNEVLGKLTRIFDGDSSHLYPGLADTVKFVIRGLYLSEKDVLQEEISDELLSRLLQQHEENRSPVLLKLSDIVEGLRNDGTR